MPDSTTMPTGKSRRGGTAGDGATWQTTHLSALACGHIRRLAPEFEVVSRRLHRPMTSVETVLTDGPRLFPDGVVPLDVNSALRFREPFSAPGRQTNATWRATAQLHGPGLRLIWSARVVIELAAWSDHTCELRIRPASRRVRSWSRYRQRRYFELAHLAGDRIAALLATAPRDTSCHAVDPLAHPANRALREARRSARNDSSDSYTSAASSLGSPTS